MPNIKTPGIVWVLLIVAVILAANYYLHDPNLIGFLIVAASIVLKSLTLNDAEQEQAELLIAALRGYIAQISDAVEESKSIAPDVSQGEQMRGPGNIAGLELLQFPELPELPEPPAEIYEPLPERSWVSRFLWG